MNGTIKHALALLTALLLAPLGVLHANDATQAVKRPNVLFIAVDDLRPQLGCYGVRQAHTPQIDRLAARGVVFERAYCQYPVCHVTRASLLSGLRPDSLGKSVKPSDIRRRLPGVVFLPEYFREHGYHTQAFGKIYHGSFETAYVGRSFDDEPSWSVRTWLGSPQYYFTPQGIEVAREVYARKYRRPDAGPDDWKKEFVQGLATEAPDVPDDTLYDGEMTARAVRTLSEIKGKQPFFLAVGYLKPHLPFVAPKKYWDLYDRAALRLPDPAAAPEGAPPMARQSSGELRGQYTNMRNEPLREEQVRELLHGYHACVSYIDALLGRLLAALDEQGLRENTIIVLWGDHGWHLGEQGLWAKLTGFEASARVPLIVVTPGTAAAGGHSRALVEFVDLFPSLCELTGLPRPAHLEGTSFVPLVQKPDQTWKSAAFTQVVRGQHTARSMRTERYRFTRWHPNGQPGKTAAIELYDLQDDPWERVNIAQKPENAALVEELARKLEAGWRSALPQETTGQ